MTSKIRCHYEVLGVERTANNDDLKKAYRKLMLKFHPDKNPGSVDEATAQFQLMQQAYEVLKDPQERAWYDRHREAILRGGQGKGDKYEDNSLNLFQYFTSSCYSGFEDDEKGFYAVYREVFKTVSVEDYEFIADKESDFSFPEFGDSQSDYDEVVKPFYDFWASFCTAKSYMWVEEYDTREAPERRVRRLMEAENKKKRDAAKKERNEEIRALIAFVRKRDKRVQENEKKLEQRAAEIEKKTKEKREKELQERSKRRENYRETGWENYQETGWSATSGLENDIQRLEVDLAKQFGDHSDDDDDDDDDVDDYSNCTGDAEEGAANDNVSAAQLEEEDIFDILFCHACNKYFKSENAMSNHERSKKHKEMVAILRAQLELDEEMMEEQEEETTDSGCLSQEEETTEAGCLSQEEETTEAGCLSQEEETTEAGGGGGGGTKEKQTEEATDRLKADAQTEENQVEVEEYVSRNKLKKPKKKKKQKLQEDVDDEDDLKIVTSFMNNLVMKEVENYGKRNGKSKKSKRKDRKAAQTSSPEDEDVDDEDDLEIVTSYMNNLVMKDDDRNEEEANYGKRNGKSKKSKRKDRKAAQTSSPEDETTTDAAPENSAEQNEASAAEVTVEGKQSMEGEETPAEEKVEEQTTPEVENQDKVKASGQSARPVKVKDLQKCLICKQSFASRSKLFDHIKSSGHVAPKPETAGGVTETVETGTKKGKKKGKR
ncbi:hypothetical protein ACOMHN_019550 [Nucella lapillus]